MANLRLKKVIWEIVNNQLEDNNPPETKDVYDKQPYDEKRYTDALNRMVQQCIDYGDTYHIRTEWD